MTEAILVPWKIKKEPFLLFCERKKKNKKNKNLVPYKRGTEENVCLFVCFSFLTLASIVPGIRENVIPSNSCVLQSHIREYTYKIQTLHGD